MTKGEAWYLTFFGAAGVFGTMKLISLYDRGLVPENAAESPWTVFGLASLIVITTSAFGIGVAGLLWEDK